MPSIRLDYRRSPRMISGDHLLCVARAERHRRSVRALVPVALLLALAAMTWWGA